MTLSSVALGKSLQLLSRLSPEKKKKKTMIKHAYTYNLYMPLTTSDELHHFT